MQTNSSSPWDQVRAYVFDDAPGNRYVAGRTLRAFGRCGMPIEDLSGETPQRIAENYLAIARPDFAAPRGNVAG